MDSAALDATIVALKDTQLAKLTSAAGYCLFIYDILLTSGREYQYIWKAGWSWGKVLYIIIRYVIFGVATIAMLTALHPDPPVNYCKKAFLCEVHLGMLANGVIHVVFALRTYTLWDRRKWVLMFLLPMAAASTAIIIVFTWLSYPGYSWAPNPLPGVLVGCYQTCTTCDRFYDYYWILLLCYDASVFVLTIIKLHQYSKQHAQTPLLQILYLDGFMYFLVIFAATLTIQVSWAAGRQSQLLTLIAFHRAFSSVMCCRLLLNLRAAVFSKSYIYDHVRDAAYQLEPITYGATYMTTMRFAPDSEDSQLGTTRVDVDETTENGDQP